MGKQTLTFLGRDSGFGKENNSAYIELDNSFILVDCGYTVFNKVFEKFDLTKYDSVNVIVTHLHNDHAGSLSHFVSYLWFNHNKKVTVISKCKNIVEYLDITGTPREAYNLIDHLDCIDLELIETKHTPNLDAYGFKATINNRKIVYTGDTSIIEPFLPYLNNIDEVYIDTSITGGSHLKIDDMLNLLRDLKNKGTDVYLMHLQNKEKIKQITNGEFNID